MNSALSGSSNLGSYLHRLEVFRRVDYERDAMIAELVQKYNELHVQYEQKCIDYDDAVESRRAWQAKAMQSNRDLGEIRGLTVRSIFLAIPFLSSPGLSGH